MKCPLLLPSRRGGIRAIVEEGALKIGIRPKVVCEIDSLLALVEVVSTGVGYTVCSLDAVSRDIRAARVRAAIIRDPPLTRTLVMVLASKNALTAAARAVADLIPAALLRLVEEGRQRPILSQTQTSLHVRPMLSKAVGP
jgi:LysR family nitrogen assimilation transcriptional regulator